MTWFVQILKFILGLIIPPILREWIRIYTERKELEKFKQAEQAKLDQAKEKYKQDLEKAGDDEQAQKDAFDQFLNSSR